MIVKLYNIVGFQVGWWACVFGVNSGYPFIGPVIMSLFLLCHLFYFKINSLEKYFIFLSGIIGFIIDTIFLQSGLIQYQGLTVDNFAPLWIIAMWLGFAATVNHSLAWLQNNWILAFCLGAVSGPLSYMAGMKFDAIQFDISILSILILACVWGGIVPLLFFLNRRICL